MNRNQVYNIISEEREYQDNRSEPDMVLDMSMGEILLAMEHNMAEARKVWYKDSADWDYSSTMHYLRKVLALGVKAGEEYGIPIRQKELEL